jgi:hypothetical protein
VALTKCKECKKEVSTSAKTCPHCGVGSPATTNAQAVMGIVLMVAIGWGLYSYFGSSSDSSKTAEPEKVAISDAECQKDLQCWMERKLPEASYPCEKAVEGLAKYSSKWTDSTFEFKFDHMRWANKEKGVLIFIGDKIKFQNGFGAYQNSIYECTYDPASKTVLDATAKPGRLT